MIYLTLLISFFCLAAAFPDPIKTPGDTLNVTEAEVCTKGYAGRARNVSAAQKKRIYKAYGMDKDKPPCPCEVDHFYNLSIGGSNDDKNLWPQPYSGKWNARQKDKLEVYLWRQVCKGNLTLKEAQEKIRTNWIKAYQEYELEKEKNQGVVTQVVE